MRTIARRAFYTLAILQAGMSEYVRWIESSRPEAGYWMAHAVVSFLIAYIVFSPADRGVDRG